jgi:hypothetical protein
MFDVRMIANQVSQVTNPNISVTWLKSTGYTTSASGSRTPTTTSQQVISAQVQGLSSEDLKHTDGLNIQGVMRSVHIFGNVQGVVRIDQQGGDILQFPELPGGAIRNWKVIQVMETWPTWSRVLVALQS